MATETTTAEKDGYWYRLVLRQFPKWFILTWGDRTGEYNYRADLEYLGKGTYWLRNRTFNGGYYKPDERFKHRHRKRCYAYGIILRLIERLLL